MWGPKKGREDQNSRKYAQNAPKRIKMPFGVLVNTRIGNLWLRNMMVCFLKEKLLGWESFPRLFFVFIISI